MRTNSSFTQICQCWSIRSSLTVKLDLRHLLVSDSPLGDSRFTVVTVGVVKERLRPTALSCHGPLIAMYWQVSPCFYVLVRRPGQRNGTA